MDGGLGAIRAIKSAARLRGVEFLVACDVRAKFTDAAKLFGAQKGATPAQIEFLTSRMHALVQTYKDEFGPGRDQKDPACNWGCLRCREGFGRGWGRQSGVNRYPNSGFSVC